MGPRKAPRDRNDGAGRNIFFGRDKGRKISRETKR